MWNAIGGWLAAIAAWIGSTLSRAFAAPPPPQVADFKAAAEMDQGRVKQADARYDALAKRLDDAEAKRDREREENAARIGAMEERHARDMLRLDERHARDMERTRRELAACRKQHEADVGRIEALGRQNADQQRQIDEMRKTMGVPTAAGAPNP